jgi:dihydrofolate synthase/folylpolyglutamate synthase
VRYAAALAYLYGLEPLGMSPGLGRMARALAARGSPERSFRAIQVAGTNGKGSVAALIASGLRASGVRVGLYTSPHLHRLVERFRVNGRAMPASELARRVAELAPWLQSRAAPRLTFFEVCTLLAFEWFRDQRCELAVLETGLGGRLDATNVVHSELGVITSLALDHTDRLGPTLRHIAREKAGIIKSGADVIVGVRDAEALSVIDRKARRVGARLWRIEHEFAVTQTERPARGEARRSARQQTYDVWVGSELVRGLPSALPGAYQADNLGCAVAVLHRLRARGWPIDERALRRGLSGVRWPGRLEYIPGPPDVLCDAAHNPEACAQLAEHVARSTYPRKVLIFGVLRDKDHARMLALLRPHFSALLFVTPASPRGLPAAELRARFGGASCDDAAAALKHARKLAGKRGLIVAAGSILVMSAVRAQLLGLREDPKIAL